MDSDDELLVAVQHRGPSPLPSPAAPSAALSSSSRSTTAVPEDITDTSLTQSLPAMISLSTTSVTHPREHDLDLDLEEHGRILKRMKTFSTESQSELDTFCRVSKSIHHLDLELNFS
jgi:CCR4-NOT transcriptional regulation complex NOT5 subunit